MVFIGDSMVKTITITEEAYHHLKEMKREDESFTKFVERLYHGGRKLNLDDFAGILTKEEGEEIKKTVKETRKNLDIGLKKRAKKLGL